MQAQWLRGIRQDFTFAARMLAKDRRFTVAAVVALGLAIGLNNSVFTLINTALIRDLPFRDADRLVAIAAPAPGGARALSYPEFLDLAAGAPAFEGIAAAANASMSLSEVSLPPERFRGSYVTANTFRLLGIAPALGRDFLPEDDRPGAPPVLMLGHAVWQARYGSDPSVIGRTVKVNDVPATIVGVMPLGFSYPFVDQMWQPIAARPTLLDESRRSRALRVVGRLADDARIERGRAEVDALAARLAREFPETNRDVRFDVVSLRAEYGRFSAPMLLTFLGAVSLVLLVACANLANLLLARSAGRAREIAIRTAVGATRWHVVRQLLVECLVIAGLAGVLGTVLSIYGAGTIAVGFDVYEAAAPSSAARPFWVDLSLDGATLAFVGLLCVLATLACGLVPALYTSRTRVSDVLKSSGGGAGHVSARRWSAALVVAELAVTLVLLSAAGLLWRSFVVEYTADPIIGVRDLVTMRLSLAAEKYPAAEDRKRFLDRLDERLGSLPSIESAAVASAPPFDFPIAERRLSLDGADAEPGRELPSVSYLLAGARYFDTVRLPMARGRAFTEADALAGQEGAIVDERFVAAFLPEGNPLGRRFRLLDPGSEESQEARWFTVVGVAPTLPAAGPPQFVRPVVYVPRRVEPSPAASAAILVRDPSGLRTVTALLREEVRRLDPDLPLYAIESMEAIVARQWYGTRLLGTWSGAIASLALLVASVGLYALTAHAVAQRRREIGVRMALGAQPRQVVTLFLRRSIAQLALGGSLGLAGAFAGGRLLQGFLAGISPSDPLTLALVSALLVVVALCASVVPARRATRVDPVTALRAD